MNDVIMYVMDCSSMGKLGVVFSGKLNSGTLKEGARIRLSKGDQHFEDSVRDLEVFRQREPVAQKGDTIAFRIAPEAGNQWQDAEVRKISLD